MVLSNVSGVFVVEDYSYTPHVQVSPSLEFYLSSFVSDRDFEVEYNNDADLTRVYRRENGRIPDDWIRVSFDADGLGQIGSYKFNKNGIIDLPGEAINISITPLINPPLKLGVDYAYTPADGRVEYLTGGRAVTGDLIKWSYPLPVAATQVNQIRSLEDGLNTIRVSVGATPIWSISIRDIDTGDILDAGTDYSIDYREGVIRVTSDGVTEVEMNYSSGTLTPYATVTDYLQTYENPEVSQKNNTAVWSALERATQRIKAIFYRVGQDPPAVPLSPQFDFLQVYTLQLSRVYLKLCRDQDDIEAIMSELSRLEKQLGHGRGRGMKHKRGKRYVSPLPDIVDPRLHLKRRNY